MAARADEIKHKVKEHLLREFMPGESPDALGDTTPLITGGVLSSIDTVRLVMFLEDEFGIEFKAHEVDSDNMDTLAEIVSLVEAKMG